MKKQRPRKLMEKILKRREKRKRNKLPARKIDKDILYEKTKKLAKQIGVRFLRQGENVS